MGVKRSQQSHGEKMKLFIIALIAIQFYTLANYQKAVAALGEAPKEIVKTYATCEVPIPRVYDAKELADYCKYEYPNYAEVV